MTSKASRPSRASIPDLSPFEALVNSICTQEFGPVLSKFYATFLILGECTVYYFPLNEPPQCILAEAPDDRSAIAKSAAEQYIKSRYLDDDNLLDLQTQIKGRSYVVCRVHRDEVKDANFKNWFYETGIEAKLLILARLGSGYVNTNLYRFPNQPPFSKEDMDRFKKVSRFAFTCLKLHVSNMDFGIDIHQRDGRLYKIEQLLMNNSHAHITERESEVCARIILGYSTTAIALNLGITENTVATIRKRAYSRLNISSQNELFEMVFENLLGHGQELSRI